MRKSEEEPRTGEPTRTWKNEREAPVFLQGTILPGPKISLSLNLRGTFFSFFSNLVRIIYFTLKEPTCNFVSPLLLHVFCVYFCFSLLPSLYTFLSLILSFLI